MSRSASSDYSAKHTVSTEGKSISAKRLYRGVLECVKKLDAGHQHRRSLISLFQPNQVKLRHKLREACERLLFSYPLEYGRKAEELLWKKVYYDVIHAVKSGRKFQSNAPGALQQKHLQPHFRQFLYSATGYYHYLLLRLQSKVRSGLVEIDFSLASRPLHKKAHSATRGSYGITKTNQDEEEKELEEWMKTTSYRLLVCLGDLSRYQMEFGGSRSRPVRFYRLALLARPDAGMPHNQLATLSGHHSWWGLVAAYHYCRSLHAEMAFDGAEGNLQKLLDRNKKLFYQLPTDALDNVISTTAYKKEHTRIFVVSFLYLCDLLRPKTYATDVEIAGLCKRLIDALIVCLTNITAQAETTTNVHLNNESAAGEAAENTSRSFSPSKRKPQSKQSGAVLHLTGQHTGKHHHHHHQQQTLNEAIVFKICVLCLVNVHDLQSCRSNRSSAAIAFALAFFSHLLGHLINCLSNQQTDQENGSIDADDKAHGDQQEAGKSKTKKTKLRIRRRRRAGAKKRGHEGDLSEGEDTLAGGDAGSNSDGSEEDSNSGSETLSESSGSGARLSQEYISSHEEDSDTPEAEHPEKKASSLEEQNVELPQQNLDNLKDLSNKMFQPSSLKRKITLAPSFLQHLSSPSSKSSSPGKVAAASTDDVMKNAKSSHGDQSAQTESFDRGNGEKLDYQKGADDVNQTPKPRTEADKKLAVRRLRLLARHHHVTACVKLLADWLWCNERVAVACAKSSRALWGRLVCLVNLLPTDLEMREMDEVQNDLVLRNQLDFVLQQVTEPLSKGDGNCAERKSPKPDVVEAKKPAWEVVPKISIQKREEKAPCPKPAAGWRQIHALPEDRAVHRMSGVREATDKAGIDLGKSALEMSDLQQVVFRTSRLRHLCRALRNIDDIEIDVTDPDVRPGDEQFTGPEEQVVVDPQVELQAVEAMRKDRLMKDMATSRLRSEVQALESSLGNQKSRESALCLHLVPTVAALCFELGHVKKLVSSERFVVTIPKTVIDGLDAVKKELVGSREAIRYLEVEFKKGNKFIRAQAGDELAAGCVSGEAPKLRRIDIEAWRLCRITECCRFLMKREAEKTGTDVGELEGIVAILTRERDTYSDEQTAVLKQARSLGIQVSSALSFSKSWTKIE